MDRRSGSSSRSRAVTRMRDVYLWVAVAETVVVIPLLIRLARGPSISDRIVALNTMATQATIALLFFSAFADRTIYLDVALWLASFSYLGTVVWSRYLERGLL
jgi:multicomponent Na+:H+ antiporter subunit F